MIFECALVRDKGPRPVLEYDVLVKIHGTRIVIAETRFGDYAHDLKDEPVYLEGPVDFEEKPGTKMFFLRFHPNVWLAIIHNPRRIQGIERHIKDNLPNLLSTPMNPDRQAEFLALYRAVNSEKGDFIELSDDSDHDEPPTKIAKKVDEIPTVLIKLPNSVGKGIRREADVLTRLLQQKYLSTSTLVALLENWIASPGNRGKLCFYDNTVTQKLLLLAKETNATAFQDVNCLAAMNERSRERILQHEVLKQIFADDATEYTSLLVFDETQRHWYMVLLARFGAFVKANCQARQEMAPPRIYVFDSLLHNTKLAKGFPTNEVLGGIHVNIKDLLLPLLRVGLALFGNPCLLVFPKLGFREVRELCGQRNLYECGAFVLAFSEAIANGHLVEDKHNDACVWKWASPELPAVYGLDYDVETKNSKDALHAYRRKCYARLKACVIEGNEHIEKAEARLKKGLSAFECEDDQAKAPKKESRSSS